MVAGSSDNAPDQSPASPDSTVETARSTLTAAPGPGARQPSQTPLQPGPRGGENGLPEQIGRYRILRKLGEGGMGTVYEAEQDRPRRIVALKVIKPGFTSRDSLRRFEHESQVLGRLQHPGIAQIYEAGTHTPSPPLGEGWGEGQAEPVPYFAMEFVRGRRLDEYARDRHFGTRERMALLAQVADAVQHAHQKGVIHRDLKPGNILVPDDGQPKILDFGVARATDSDLQTSTLRTEIGQLIGTLPYMSPEQASGDPDQLDTRSDVYALGVVLYELLVGQLPYDLQRKTVLEALRVIREEEPARLSSVNKALRGDVETIVGKALEKDKDRRYASAGALAADIRRYLHDEPIAARPPSAMYQLGKFAKRNKALVGGVAATFLVLVAGLIVSTTLYLSADRARQRAVAAEQQQSRERERADEQATEARQQTLLAEAAQKEAEQRQKETQQVSDFQARMLSEIDVEAMGRGLIKHLREQVQAGLERRSVGEWPNRRKCTEEEVEAGLKTFDEAARPGNPTDVARRVMDEYVLQRADAAIEREFKALPLVEATVRNAIGKTYWSLGLYDAAEPHLRTALELRERELGREDPDVATSLNNLVLLLQDKGDYAAAEPLCRESLAMRRKLLGDEHRDVATSLNNLAALLYVKGDYAAAEPVYREALAMRRKLLGDEHPDVATSLNNLATLLYVKGDYAAAEPVYREALAMRRKLQDDEHPDMAKGLINLAGLLKAKGDYAAAEPLYREALAMLRKLLGDEHPNVAQSLGHLAGLLQAKGDYAAAEPLFREALAMRRKLLGDEHPDVATSLNSLAALLRDIGNYAAAEPLFREALAMRRKLQGDEHPDVANSLINLAALLRDIGNYAAADPLYRESLALFRKLLGDEHPTVATTLNNLAALLQDKGDYAAAEPLLREALEMRRKLLGDEHPNVAISLHNLGLLLRTKGDYAAAEPLLREALEMNRKLLGDEHPDVATTLNSLAALLKDKGDYVPAEPLLREALAIRETKLLVGHLGTAETRGALGRVLAELGRFSEAEPLLLAAWNTVDQAPKTPAKLKTKIGGDVGRLYEMWHAAEPDKGYDAKAADWRGKLAAWQASTQPASQPSASQPATHPASTAPSTAEGQ
ncbi:MAG: tetratricopeptide repeat protein [Planctomycetota bacterium]